MSYTTDNRWTPNAGVAPEGATAVYSARWIDNGSSFDIVHDRQGFAYNDAADRDALIKALGKAQPHKYATIERGEQWQPVIGSSTDPFHVSLRRFGGYVYCEAWLS